VTAPRAVRRRFPDYGWAWPRGNLDLLLKAILLPDEESALQAALSWLAANELDDAEFRDHRLLIAVSERFGKRLAGNPAQPRLVGLQRRLWTRSRLARRDNADGLAALGDAGIPFMLIKGASRIALDSAAQRGRVSHDTDILVRPDQMKSAFVALFKRGWQSATGAGPLHAIDHATGFRAMNFLKGEYGDIDIHQQAYQPVHRDIADEEGLWRRSLAVEFDGIAARVPAAGDRIALAIAHGALDAHTHSDWLIDVASAVRGNDVDWDTLLRTLKARRAVVAAASSLSYLAQEIGIAIPEPALRSIIDAADEEKFISRFALLESKPRTDFTPLSAIARGVVKQLRLWRERRTRRAAVRENLWRARIAWRVRTGTEPPAGLGPMEIQVAPGKVRVEVVVRIDLPPCRRRVELELSSASRHLALLRYRKHFRFSGTRELTFRGTLDLRPDETSVFLEARPARFMRSEDERYGALPFSISHVSVQGR
jgi:hypothetical protein